MKAYDYFLGTLTPKITIALDGDGRNHVPRTKEQKCSLSSRGIKKKQLCRQQQQNGKIALNILC